MTQGPGLDARSLEVAVQIVLPEPEHAIHLVCGDVSLVDEAVQLPQADTEVRAGSRSPHALSASIMRIWYLDGFHVRQQWLNVGQLSCSKCWVIVGVCGFSRFLGAWMIPSDQAHDVFGGHRKVLHQFGGLPRMGVLAPGGPASCTIPSPDLQSRQ